jgi:hypothetical protein
MERHNFLFTLLSLLFVCCHTPKNNTFVNTGVIKIDRVLLKGQYEISKHLKRNNFNTSKSKTIYGMLYVSTLGAKEICPELLVNGHLNFYDFFQKWDDGSMNVSAYFVNNDNVLFAQSSGYTLIRNIKSLSYHNLYQKITQLVINKKYKAFIKVSCEKKEIIIGYDDYFMDIYDVIDNDLVFKSTIINNAKIK